mgnify:FL=1
MLYHAAVGVGQAVKTAKHSGLTVDAHSSSKKQPPQKEDFGHPLETAQEGEETQDRGERREGGKSRQTEEKRE